MQQAAGTLPSGASLDTVRQYYRGGLNSRGYVRDQQMDPPPPGSYRGIENREELNAAVQAAMGPGSRQTFEQQLAQLDNLKARGRITEDSLVGRSTGFVQGGALQPFSLSLTWDGAVLRGTSTGSNNLPRGVEFTRDRP